MKEYTEEFKPNNKVIRGKVYVSYTATLTSKLINEGLMPFSSTNFTRPDGSHHLIFLFNIDNYLVEALSRIFDCPVIWEDK